MPEGAKHAVLGQARDADGYSWYPVAYGGRSGWPPARISPRRGRRARIRRRERRDHRHHRRRVANRYGQSPEAMLAVARCESSLTPGRTTPRPAPRGSSSSCRAPGAPPRTPPTTSSTLGERERGPTSNGPESGAKPFSFLYGARRMRLSCDLSMDDRGVWRRRVRREQGLIERLRTRRSASMRRRRSAPGRLCPRTSRAC